MPASTLSFHLKELTHAGLVTQQRDGRHLFYRPVLEQMNELLAYLVARSWQDAKAGLEMGTCGVGSSTGFARISGSGRGSPHPGKPRCAR